MNRVLRSFFAGAVLWAGFGQAAAQSLGTNTLGEFVGRKVDPQMQLPNCDIANIAPIIAGLGFKVTSHSLDNTNKMILAAHSSGLRLLVVPTACAAGPGIDCKGVNFGALFSSVPQSLAAEFNNKANFAHVSLGGQSAAIVTRYDIANYGISEGNFAVLIRLFMRDVLHFWQMKGGNSGTSAVNLDVGEAVRGANNSGNLAEDRLAEDRLAEEKLAATGDKDFVTQDTQQSSPLVFKHFIKKDGTLDHAFLNLSEEAPVDFRDFVRSLEEKF